MAWPLNTPWLFVGNPLCGKKVLARGREWSRLRTFPHFFCDGQGGHFSGMALQMGLYCAQLSHPPTHWHTETCH